MHFHPQRPLISESGPRTAKHQNQRSYSARSSYCQSVKDYPCVFIAHLFCSTALFNHWHFRKSELRFYKSFSPAGSGPKRKSDYLFFRFSSASLLKNNDLITKCSAGLLERSIQSAAVIHNAVRALLCSFHTTILLLWPHYHEL